MDEQLDQPLTEDQIRRALDAMPQWKMTANVNGVVALFVLYPRF